MEIVFRHRVSRIRGLTRFAIPFWLGLAVLLASPDASAAQRVLLLHSYAPPMAWVESITAEIESELALNPGGVDLRLEYMDTKRHFGAEYLDSFRSMLALKYHDTPFDLIFAIDNNAYDFLRRHRGELFPGVPVVFCGVNGFDPDDIAGLDDFTGVAEIYDPLQTVECMLRLHPETTGIFVVNDYLTTGREVRRSIAKDLQALSGRVSLTWNEDVPLSRLEEQLADLEPGQLCLLGTYFTDAAGQVSGFAEAGERLAAASAVPVYCLLDFNLTGGIVGGHVTGAALQGLYAARLGASVLAAAPAELPAPTRAGTFDWRFHHAALRRWGIDEADLPPGSTIVGRPDSFFAVHRGLVVGVLATIAFLLLVIGTLTVNIRRRQRAESRLRLSEENLATTLSSMGDGLIATDHEGRIVRLNPAAEQLLGWPLEQARGRPLTEVFRLKSAETAPPDGDVDLSFRTVLESGQAVAIARGTILVRRDDSEILIADSGAPIRSSDGRTRGVVIVFRDVTESLEMERRLMQAQKMESVGQLAGGVAHDFNNMLTGILGHAELLQMDLQEEPEKLDSINRILRAGERASHLTRKLLDFSRQGKTLSTPLDLHEVVRDSLSLLTRTVGQGIHIESVLGAKRATLVGDPTQLQQLVMNLCINARDAMPGGGVIRIRTETVELGREDCDESPFELEPGAYVRLTIGDTGAGIPPELQDRIFEPFYTTKERGRGTGLGLSAVYGCVKTHHGAIRLESALQRGTTFFIDLPLQEVEVRAAPQPSAPGPVRRQGTVLVVDDDETVRGMAQEMLDGMGYRVLAAEDGVEALEIFGRRRKEIDVVLLDLVMPGLSGRPTFQAMRRIDPRISVVLNSGFAEPGAVSDLLEEGLAAFISKPYRRAELDEAIGAALRRTRTRRGEQ